MVKQYRIYVPKGSSSLNIETTGGLGDVDVYARRLNYASPVNYYFASIQYGNNEQVIINDPPFGEWYIYLQPKNGGSYSGVSLTTSIIQRQIIELEDGVTISGINYNPLTDVQYRIYLPEETWKLIINTSNGSGDVDIYIRRSGYASSSLYDYSSTLVGNNENIIIEDPTPGYWYIFLKPKNGDTFSGIDLTVSKEFRQIVDLTNGQTLSGISHDPFINVQYRIHAPFNSNQLMISISGGNGDADVYVNRFNFASESTYWYSSTLIGNDETIIINNPGQYDWYIFLKPKNNGTFDNINLSVNIAENNSSSQIVDLMDGVSLSGINYDPSINVQYRIYVNHVPRLLSISASGGNGDVDLYVNRSNFASISNYFYKSNLIGNQEFINEIVTAGGDWYINLIPKNNGSFSDINLIAKTVPIQIINLTSGITISGINYDPSVYKLYKIYVTKGMEMIIDTSGESGDVDIYVNNFYYASPSNFQFYSTSIGNDEHLKLKVDDLYENEYYIYLHPKNNLSYSNVNLTVTLSPRQIIDLTNGATLNGINYDPLNETQYRIYIPLGSNKLTIQVNCDPQSVSEIYLNSKYYVVDRNNNYIYRNIEKSNETIVICNPPSGDMYIYLKPEYNSTYSNVSLTVTYT